MATMNALAAGAARVMVPMVFPWMNSITSSQRHVNKTDEENPVEAVPLGPMNDSGVRQRVTASHAQQSSEEVEGTTSTTSDGEDTPTSFSMEERPHPVAESFVELSWRRILSALGLNSSSRYATISKQQMGHDQFKKQWNLEDYPNGYPRAAVFVSSDSDVGIVRRFTMSHNRILLHDQTEIVQLEKSLKELDEEDAADWKRSKRRLHRSIPEGGRDKRQMELIQKLRHKLKEYRETALGLKSMQDLNQPNERSYLHYWNFFWTTKPLDNGHWDYLRQANDFATLSENSTNFFQDLIQSHMYNCPRSLLKRVLSESDENKPTDNKAGTFYNKRRLNICTRILVILTAVGLVLTPATLLFLVPMSHTKMTIMVTCFLVPFTLLMLAITENLGEIFIAIATYSAVLFTLFVNLGASAGCGCSSVIA